MSRITLEDSAVSALMKIAEGNPGAIQTLFDLIKKYPVDGIVALCHLDDMKIYGWRIWICIKDYCRMDIDKFYNCIVSRDKQMLELVRKEEKLQGDYA